MQLLNGINIQELLEELPPKKQPYLSLCLSLKKKEAILIEFLNIQLNPLKVMNN